MGEVKPASSDVNYVYLIVDSSKPTKVSYTATKKDGTTRYVAALDANRLTKCGTLVDVKKATKGDEYINGEYFKPGTCTAEDYEQAAQFVPKGIKLATDLLKSLSRGLKPVNKALRKIYLEEPEFKHGGTAALATFAYGRGETVYIRTNRIDDIKNLMSQWAELRKKATEHEIKVKNNGTDICDNIPDDLKKVIWCRQVPNPPAPGETEIIWSRERVKSVVRKWELSIWKY